jgi:hypothetical protein
MHRAQHPQLSSATGELLQKHHEIAGTPAPPPRKAVSHTATRILPPEHSVRSTVCLSLRKNAGIPEEKVQNPNHRGTRD